MSDVRSASGVQIRRADPADIEAAIDEVWRFWRAAAEGRASVTTMTRWPG